MRKVVQDVSRIRLEQSRLHGALGGREHVDARRWVHEIDPHRVEVLGLGLDEEEPNTFLAKPPGFASQPATAGRPDAALHALEDGGGASAPSCCPKTTRLPVA